MPGHIRFRYAASGRQDGFGPHAFALINPAHVACICEIRTQPFPNTHYGGWTSTIVLSTGYQLVLYASFEEWQKLVAAIEDL